MDRNQDGIPATGNRGWLTDLLRRQWGLRALMYHTSVNEMTNHGMGDLQTASALKAGRDMEMMGAGFSTTLQKIHSRDSKLKSLPS